MTYDAPSAVPQLTHAPDDASGCARNSGGSTRRGRGGIGLLGGFARTGGEAGGGPGAPDILYQSRRRTSISRSHATTCAARGPGSSSRGGDPIRSVGAYRDERRWERRGEFRRDERVEARGARRSHAAIPVAVAVVLAGLFLSHYSIVVPGLLGVALLASGLSFLSSRLNPLSPHYYLDRKPSWAATGVLFLGALVLLGETYALWVSGAAPLVPGL